MIIAFAAILLAIMFFSLDDENEALDPSKDPFQQKAEKEAEGWDEFCRWAIKELNKVSSEKLRASSYAHRGDCYSQLGDYEEALDDFEDAIKLNRLYLNTYRYRGNTYMAMREYNKAIEDFTFVIENFKDEAGRLRMDSEVYDSRGEAYYNLGDYEKALSDFNKSYSSRYSPQSQDNLIKTYRKLGRHDQAYQLEPKSADDYYKRANIFGSIFGDPNYKKAIEEIDKAYALEANATKYHLMRSTIFDRLKDFKQASIEAKKACELGDCRQMKYLESIGKFSE
jgi:tetratricopeptide (TPR) repeat protein